MEHIETEEITLHNVADREAKIFDDALTLRGDIVSYLGHVRQYRVKFFTGQSELQTFERDLDTLNSRLVDYDNAVAIVLNFFANDLAGSNLGSLVQAAVHCSTLSSSSENLRTLLRECSNSLRNRQMQIENRTATRIAIVALLATVLLGLLSVIVAVIQLYVSPDATLPSLH